MTFTRSGWPMARKYWRASFHAESTASAPPVVRNTRLRSPGARPASRSASSMAGGVGVGPQREVGEGLGLGRPPPRAISAPAVAGLHDEEPGEAVEVAVALGVPHVGALAPLDDGGPGAALTGQPGEVQPEVVGGGLGQLVGGHRHRVHPRSADLLVSAVLTIGSCVAWQTDDRIA